MKRIHEALTEKAAGFTKGQRLLARFITEQCEKAAFMSSFDLASVTGVSQSTVIRFAAALGYAGYGDFQDALQLELKYRLTTLEHFAESGDGESTEKALLDHIAAQDAMNIKKNSGLNPLDALHNLCTRLMLSGRVYLYGQGCAACAAVYLASYLRILLPNVCCINQLGMEPVSAAALIGEGDLLLCISFPQHQQTTLELIAYAQEQEACVAVVSESHDSPAAREAEISLVAECGELGLGGSLAPVISLCGSLVSLLARSDEKAQKKLNAFYAAAQYRPQMGEQLG